MVAVVALVLCRSLSFRQGLCRKSSAHQTHRQPRRSMRSPNYDSRACWRCIEVCHWSIEVVKCHVASVLCRIGSGLKWRDDHGGQIPLAVCAPAAPLRLPWPCVVHRENTCRLVLSQPPLGIVFFSSSFVSLVIPQLQIFLSPGRYLYRGLMVNRIESESKHNRRLSLVRAVAEKRLLPNFRFTEDDNLTYNLVPLQRSRKGR
jgi:hypothetical protein